MPDKNDKKQTENSGETEMGGLLAEKDEALAAKEQRLAELERELTARDDQITALNESAAGLEQKLSALEESLAQAVASYRALAVKYNPGLPEEQIAGDSVMGRPHIAQALLEKGYIDSFRQAFADYIGRNGPAYVEREKITPAQAVALIVRSGGLASLAHPFTVSDPEAMIIELKAAGLAGLEAYYNGYDRDETETLLNLARKHALVTTGGSDFHGLEASETPIGGIDLPLEAVEQLIARARQMNPALSF